jgi:predicted glycosyltransferase
MNIIFDIGHPAHVHLFKNAIAILEKKEHNILVTAREKDVTLQLLKKLGVRYKLVGKNKNGLFNKAVNLFNVEYELLKVSKNFKPDIFVSVGSPYAAHIATFLRKPSLAFVDTEHAKLSGKLTYPFTTYIFTPNSFKLDYGSKHFKYDSFHDLAYLHPKYFKPNKDVLDKLGLEENEKYSLLRFVAWSASHDINQSGITDDMKVKYINELEQYGKVFVSSESELGPEFSKNRLNIPVEQFHSMLSHASLYIGEGGSTATEAAVLGTPSIHISTTAKYCGVFDELKKYNLIHTYDDDSDALKKAKEILGNANYKSDQTERKDKLINDKIDLTEYIVDKIENINSY